MNTSAAVLVFATMLAVVGMAQSAPAASPDDAAQPWHPDSLMARPVEVRYVQVVVDAVVDDPSLPADALGGGSWKGSPPLESDGDRVVIKDWSLAMLAREGDTLVELVDGRTINGRSVAYTTLYVGVSGTSMSVPVAGHDLVILQTGPDGALFTGPFFGTDRIYQVSKGTPLTVLVDDVLEEVLWEDRHGERVSLAATYNVTMESFGDVTLDLKGREQFQERPDILRSELDWNDRRMRLAAYRL